MLLGLIIASNGWCEESVFTGSQLRVIDVDDGRDRPSFEINSVRMADDSVIEVGFENREDLPITLTGIIIILDSFGRPGLVIGSTEYYTGQIVAQGEPGSSSSRIVCLPSEGVPEDYNVGTYGCIRTASFKAADASSAILLLSDALIDNGDRD